MTESKRTNTMNWYVIRTQNNREKGIKEKLIKAKELPQYKEIIGQVEVPVEPTFIMKDGKRIKRDKIFYPGYIFIETNAVGELNYLLRGITGSQGFLKNRHGEISPLTTKEIKDLKEKLNQENIEELLSFHVDEMVMIIDGPFKEMKASIEKMDGDNIKLMVSIFGRKTPIDLNINQITKIKK